MDKGRKGWMDEGEHDGWMRVGRVGWMRVSGVGG